MTRRSQHGLTLIVVLWGVALLSLMTAAVCQSARTHIAEVRLHTHRIAARALAEGEIYRAIAELAANRTYSFSPSTPGHLELSHTIEDEAGKLDLNTTGAEEFTQALRSLVGTDSAATLADRIMDWRDPDDAARPRGGESAAYRAAGLNFGPRNDQFRHTDELAQVLGISPAVAGQLAPLVTVHSRRPQVDLSVAPPALRRALDPTGSSKTPALGDSARSSSGHALKITARASLDEAKATASATVLLTGQPQAPYRILSWEWDQTP